MRKNFVLLLEVFIWIFILGGLTLLGIDTVENYFAGRTSYQIIFKDIDGLTVGAPVRFMGIQAGHVTEVIPGKNEVMLSFVITNPNIKILKGSVITVQFTGLAGSKSLEIASSQDKSQSGQFVQIVEPVRVSSLMDIQTQMSESILDCSGNILDMFGKTPPESIKDNVKYVKRVTENVISSTDNANSSLKSANITMKNSTERLNSYLVSSEKGIDTYSSYVQRNMNSKGMKYTVTNFTQSIDDLYSALRSDSDYSSFVALNIKKININLKELKAKSQKVNSNEELFINQLDKRLNQPITVLNYFTDRLESSCNKNNIDRVQEFTRSLNSQTKKIENSL